MAVKRKKTRKHHLPSGAHSGVRPVPDAPEAENVDKRKAAAKPGRIETVLYPLLMLATIGVTFGGIGLLLHLLSLSQNILTALGLIIIVIPLIRVIGDAVNPDVPNPQSLDGYMYRYQSILLLLVTYFSVFALLLPVLILALGLMGSGLLAIVTAFGSLFWVLQHWFDMQVGREMAVSEINGLLLMLGGSIVAALVCFGLITLAMYIKDKLEDRFWAAIHAARRWLEQR